MDEEDIHTAREEGAIQPPTRLELAGIGRHGSVYYKAASPGRSSVISSARLPQRSGARHHSNSKYQAPSIPGQEDKSLSYPTDQVDHGHGSRPTPDQGRLDQRRASEVSLYSGNRQPSQDHHNAHFHRHNKASLLHPGQHAFRKGYTHLRLYQVCCLINRVLHLPEWQLCSMSKIPIIEPHKNNNRIDLQL